MKYHYKYTFYFHKDFTLHLQSQKLNSAEFQNNLKAILFCS